MSTEGLGVGGGAEVVYWGVYDPGLNGKTREGYGLVRGRPFRAGGDMELQTCMRQRSSAHFPQMSTVRG